MATLWNLSRLNNTIGTLVGGTWNHAFGYNTMWHKQIYKYIPGQWVRTSGLRPPYTPSMPIKDGGLSMYGHDITTLESIIGNLGYYTVAQDITSTTEFAILWLIVSIYASDTITTSESGLLSGIILISIQDTTSTSESVFAGAIIGFQIQDNVIIDEVVKLWGLGNMEMRDGFPEGLTPEWIRFAVWSSLAGDNNIPGTMGEKLNTAGSGGVDINALADAIIAKILDLPEGILTPEQIDLLINTVKKDTKIIDTDNGSLSLFVG